MSFSAEEISELQRIGRLEALGPGGACVITPSGHKVNFSKPIAAGWSASTSIDYGYGPQRGSPRAAYLVLLMQRAERFAAQSAEVQAELDRVRGDA